MAGFTYTPGSTSDRDRVRLEIGDTDKARAKFYDEELDDIIVVEGSVLGSAARACEILATRFAADFDFSADGASFKKGDVSGHYAKMAKRLRSRARGSSMVDTTRKDGYSDDIPSSQASLLP